jgi:hypothetical protein
LGKAKATRLPPLGRPDFHVLIEYYDHWGMFLGGQDFGEWSFYDMQGVLEGFS